MAGMGKVGEVEMAAEGILDALRKEIAEVDLKLVELTARRCRLAVEAGAWKQRRGFPVEDPAQEAVVVRRAAEAARATALDAEGVRDLFWCLIGMARRAQTRWSIPLEGEG